jgi:hypothetical protein
MTRMTWVTALLVCCSDTCFGQARPDRVEPNAGSWRTWVLSSGKELRVPPPPDAGATRREIDWLRSLPAESTPIIREQIEYWDAGSPSHRWVEWMVNRAVNNRLGDVNLTPM